MKTPSALRWSGPLVLALIASVAPMSGSAADKAPRELAVCADPSNLPFSNERQEGFENQVAALIAKDLDATLRYTWNMQRRSFLRRTLKAGACDVVMGLPVGLQGVIQSRPYYASSYAFVTLRERGLQLSGFDDASLSRLKIGLQAVGADGANPPPTNALARRGLVQHVVGFPMWGEESEENPQARIVDAVAAGEVDVAIVWGPFAGYFARRYGDALVVTPIDSDPLLPTLPFRYEIALGVRSGDEALLSELQQVLDRRRDDIRAILDQYGIPHVTAARSVEMAASVGAGEFWSTKVDSRED